jgi:Flp pilus assembly protein TadD
LKDFSTSAIESRLPMIATFGIALALVLCSAHQAYSQNAEVRSAQAPVAGRSLQEIQKRLDAGQFEQAASELGSFLKNDQNSARAHAMLAYCLLRMNDPKGSLMEYTRSATLARPESKDLQNVAKDYALLNDLADADHWMTLAVRMDPKDAEAWYGLGRIRYTQQRFQEAVDCFERALVLDPGSAKTENNLGLSYEGLNRTDDATSAYRKAIKLQESSEHPSEQPLLNLGIVLLHQGKLTESEQLLTEAAAIAPSDSNIREQLGHLYLQTNELAKAQVQFEQAIALNPKNPALHFLLGRVYRAEGEDEKAKVEFARSEALSGYRSTPEKN